MVSTIYCIVTNNWRIRSIIDIDEEIFHFIEFIR